MRNSLSDLLFCGLAWPAYRQSGAADPRAIKPSSAATWISKSGGAESYAGSPEKFFADFRGGLWKSDYYSVGVKQPACPGARVVEASLRQIGLGCIRQRGGCPEALEKIG
ncbi:hypothetical protein [Kitasatospora sp. LaBMicrA B282]|uniref:hypothetical protein n=1 Tax=Kitasatospora sp. LaBMicrA B282 TaxID=3420949 RepID=UPI003D0F1876